MDTSDMRSDNVKEAAKTALIPMSEQPPTVLPAIILDDLVPFPGPVVPILLDVGVRRDAVLHAKDGQGFLLLVNRRGVGEDDLEAAEGAGRQFEGALAWAEVEEGTAAQGVVHSVDTAVRLLDTDDEPTKKGAENKRPDAAAELVAAELSPVGIVARLLRVVRLPDDRLSALVQLMRRAQPLDVIKVEPFPIVKVLYPVELVADVESFEAIYRQVRAQLQLFFEAHPSAPDQLKLAVLTIESPGALADFVAQHLSRDFAERLAFLGELDVSKRMRRALEVTLRELDLLTVGNRITQEIREKVEKHQREFLLREQLKAIRTELGEEKDPAALAVEELRVKLDKAGLPAPARERADEELRRLQLVPTESPEHNLVRSYLDWIASLPWSAATEDQKDIDAARRILDEDHHGLDEIKDRIVEFLAVHLLNPRRVGSLLCFAGPPGVGKTSLGQSVARALGRDFFRFSVGGMRDEAEIKGHRRTYVGAMPGRVLQGLRQVKSANPVFMLDEIDKMGADWRGDPSSALLEVLDPAQNKAFLDHYLDLSFDLSRVMFICTANVKSEIPAPLLDRLEVIDLPGYIPEEKLEIAMRHLAPRQRKEHGLSSRQLSIGRPAVKRIIQEYTQEAGVRELERLLGKVCRKRAIQVVRGEAFAAGVSAKDVPTVLGPPKIHDDRINQRPRPGVAFGLAWTPVGGDVLYIETASMPGKGVVKMTGKLGEVMSESAGLAVSYVRSVAATMQIAPSVFAEHDLHIHFPAGAVPKDGPSAGVTITTALISLLTGRSIRPALAMTGEMTLRGDVLPVGGIREKVVAARRMGIRTVVVPEPNRRDVEQIPEDVRGSLTFVFAKTFRDVVLAAFDDSDAQRLLGQEGPERVPVAGWKKTKSPQKSPQKNSRRSATGKNRAARATRRNRSG